MLSDIGGACLCEPEAALLELDDLRQLFRQALTAISHFKLGVDDVKLENFHLVNGKIMVVDLETMNFLPADKDVDFGILWAVERISKLYTDRQYYLWDGGYISVTE